MRRSSDYHHHHHHSVMNRIMLRFRPIAPKPAGGEPVSGAAEKDRGGGGEWKRVKRKYVRVRARKKSARMKIKEDKRKSPPPEKSGVEDEPSPGKLVTTLQLLPERSETENTSFGNFARNKNSIISDLCKVDDNVSFKATEASSAAGSEIETMIIVECVTDRFTEVGLGFSDEERINGLEKDTCPGFISDWANSVIWVNEAYKKMVAENSGIAATEKGFLVRLVVKDELPHFHPSFACRVRVIQEKSNKIVPCDVWRMGFAGFAWTLDVNTALSLGLNSGCYNSQFHNNSRVC